MNQLHRTWASSPRSRPASDPNAYRLRRLELMLAGGYAWALGWTGPCRRDPSDDQQSGWRYEQAAPQAQHRQFRGNLP
jgi:hypothetical protein